MRLLKPLIEITMLPRLIYMGWKASKIEFGHLEQLQGKSLERDGDSSMSKLI